MALYPNASPVRPNQQNQTGDIDKLAIERFTGIVEGTIERKSALTGFVKIDKVTGTNTITNKGIGEVDLQTLTPGTAPDGTGVDISKNSITVDTVVMARNIFPLLETIQTDFNVQQEVGYEQGKKIAKFRDQSFFIQAAKASMLTDSAYSGGTAGKPKGHYGGNMEVMAAAGDRRDPAKLYDAIKNLMIKFQLKDVDPGNDDVILAVGPEAFHDLMGAEQLINGNYKTADGTKLEGIPIYKAFGVPVISTNNLPNSVITNHRLSNAKNGNAYDGDFTKLVATAFSPRALLAGESISLQSKLWFDDNFKHWLMDSWLAYAVGPNRAEYAGSIWIP